MMDIRRLSLDGDLDRGAKVTQDEKVSLSPGKLERLEGVLQSISELDYWHPVYQAWEPYVTDYMMSGVNPAMAERWLRKLGDKMKPLNPPEGSWSWYYQEVLRMHKSQSAEIFPDITYNQLLQFVDHAEVYIGVERTLWKAINDSKAFREQLEVVANDHGQLYNPTMVYAVYMYRHCMLRDWPISKEFDAKFQQQIDRYVETFSKSFDDVVNFIGPADLDRYEWYSQTVKDTICHAWSSALDISTNRRVLGAKEVYSLNVGTAERLTTYINTLPCVTTYDPKDAFVFNAIEFALKEDVSEDDPNLIWVYGITRRALRKMVDNLSNLVEAVRNNTFSEYMYTRIVAQYNNCRAYRGPQKVPAAYREELRRRGFPI